MRRTTEIIIEQMVKAYSHAVYMVYEADFENGDTYFRDAARDDMYDLEDAAEAMGYYFDRDDHGYWKAVKYETRPVRLDEQDKRAIGEVAGAIAGMRYEDANRIFGSVTISDMVRLNGKIRYNDYCESHGIKYDDMTEEDFEDAALAEIDEYNDSDCETAYLRQYL